MKKSILFITLLLLLSGHVYAQMTCKECLRRIYHEIYSKNLSSIKLNDQKYKTSSLCFEQTKDDIAAAISKSKVYSYGSLLDSIVEIRLGQKVLFYRISVERPDPCFVLDVYDSNGVNLLYHNDYLRFPAIINDPEGYVNIRQNKYSHSRIVNKIKNRQIFFYTPSTFSKWYQVYLKDGGKCCGYIYRTKILPYESCPKNIRKQMEGIEN